MNRMYAILTAERCVVSYRHTYTIFCGLSAGILGFGAVMQDPTMFAGGIASLIITELWMIRKTIEAQGAKAQGAKAQWAKD